MSVQALLYLIAVILLVVAALPISTRGFSPALLGAAFALLAYSWPVLTD
jgi:small-conductance mechanosensitive channel